MESQLDMTSYGYQRSRTAELDKLAEKYWKQVYPKQARQWRGLGRVEIELSEVSEFLDFAKREGLDTDTVAQLAGYLDDAYNVHSLGRFAAYQKGQFSAIEELKRLLQ